MMWAECGGSGGGSGGGGWAGANEVFEDEGRLMAKPPEEEGRLMANHA